ncbi:YkoF family thiamine/hydroxymethylpyrimidine-binding protein [Rhodohalobacter sp.]|uniref:YkoF family thiamine/hydroxymethylpyrimidine-binding protein n=1 Tax=Rhodohalobacter sp. TaxID=1974210 RepID=UPI002ACDE8B9|nr:YkoF family thiamine/hydroxymethylpyrimidine-binding protein [Rhodohalobacter sp.]MDZ7758619.1 YkoF family thiamine/hydroxymethylpyrimidine-binding protein [Rhodohalobacter sp.]
MKTIAQLTYIPLYSDHPKEQVQDLLEFVAQHDVEVDVNYLSTSIKGDSDVVFELIREVYDSMTLEGQKFRFHVELLSPTAE